MNAEKLAKLHAPRERVAVFWPGGPYDFEIEFDHAMPYGPGDGDWRDWFLISGVVVSPVSPWPRLQSFYVHPVAGGYSLVPFRG